MWSMGKTRAPVATVMVGLLLSLPGGAYATDCIALPIKPIRHVCGVVMNLIGERIPNAKVTVLKDGKELATVQTSADGKFSCERLDAGRYDVRVEADGYLTAQDSIAIVKPTSNCRRGLEVVLAVGTACSGIGRAKH
jgi:uncharacterized membrane protein